MPASASSNKLSQSQIKRLIVSGIVIWAAAALLLRTIAPLGVFAGANRIALYVAILIGTWPFIVAVAKLAALGSDQIVRGICLLTTTALFIDGTVFAWFPSVYGNAPYQLDNAAAVLWGGASGLILAFIAENRKASAGSI